MDEPAIAELRENYVMVFRPLSEADVAAGMVTHVGAGWAIAPVPAI